MMITDNRHTRCSGATLIELLVVVLVVALLLVVIVGLSIQSAKVYVRTSGFLQPESSQMLALKNMQLSIREAMVVDTSPSPATWVDVVLPQKDSHGLDVVVQNSTTGALGLTPGDTIAFFLGANNPPADTAHSGMWIATPSVTGGTLFKVDVPNGGTMVSSDGTVHNSSIVITNLVVPAMINDPLNPGQQIPDPNSTIPPLISYPLNGSYTTEQGDRPTNDTKLINISLTIPVKVNRGHGLETVNSTLSTQFSLRNLQ